MSPKPATSGLAIGAGIALAGELAVEVGDGAENSRSAAARLERRRSRFLSRRRRVCSTWNARPGKGSKGVGDDDTGQLRVPPLEPGDVSGEELDDPGRRDARPTGGVSTGSNQTAAEEWDPPRHRIRCSERKRPSADE